MKNLDKTINDLEKIRTEIDNTTGLTKKVTSLSNKVLADFTNDDLRVCITQNMYLEYLMPIAVDRLKKVLLNDETDYEGCLLDKVLISKYDWSKDYTLWVDLYDLMEKKIIPILLGIDFDEEGASIIMPEIAIRILVYYSRFTRIFPINSPESF